MTVPREIDQREIEIYDATSEQILYAEGGTLLRTIAFAMNMVTTELDVTVQFEDGGEPLHIRTKWGATQRFQSGGKSEWEEALHAASLRAEREQLRRARRFLLYRGNPGDRERAVSDIRSILHDAHSPYVKIWDPYFGGRDALEFLFHVSDPRTPISVLTNASPTPAEQAAAKAAYEPTTWKARLLADFARVVAAGARRAGARIRWLDGSRRPRESARDRKVRGLRRALAILREPKAGVPGLRAVRCRVGGQTAFHDRFIIIEGRCWQLGCSFNQIGAMFGTVVEFPHPALIEEEFDSEWERAGERAEL